MPELDPLQIVVGTAGVWVAGYVAGLTRAWIRRLLSAA